MSSRQSSVHRKLLFVVLATTAVALGITGAAMVFYDLRTFRETWVADLTAQADILGLATAPALEFEDPSSAHAYLDLLRAKPDIMGAAIYTSKGTMFAEYSADPQTTIEFPKLPDLDGSRTVGNKLELFKRIVNDDEIGRAHV